jgi:hypothetical protein
LVALSRSGRPSKIFSRIGGSIADSIPANVDLILANEALRQTGLPLA